jgi:hypothetical protein
MAAAAVVTPPISDAIVGHMAADYSSTATKVPEEGEAG